MNFSDFLIWCFRAYLEVICKKLWKKGQNSALQGQQNDHFWPFFGHFGFFFYLEIFLANEFFWFFNMLFLGIFRSYLQKIVKKGLKFGPPGQKTTIFGHFRSFLDLEIFPMNEFFWFFNMVFLSLIRSHLQNILKKGSQFGLVGPKK